jgi:hypothetical protein
MAASSNDPPILQENDGTMGSAFTARQDAAIAASDNAALAPLYNTASGDVASGNFLGAFQAGESYDPTLITSNASAASSHGGMGGANNATPSTIIEQSAVDPVTQDLESSSGLSSLDPSKVWTAADYDSYYSALTNPSVYNNSLGANPYGLWGNAASAMSDASKNYAATPGAAPNAAQYAGATPSTSIGTKYGTAALLALITGAATAGVGSAVGAAVGGGLAGGIAGGAAGGVAGSLTNSALTGGAITLGGLGKAAALGGLGGAATPLASSLTGATGLPAGVSSALVKGGTSLLGNVASSAFGGSSNSSGTQPSSGVSSLSTPNPFATGLPGGAVTQYNGAVNPTQSAIQSGYGTVAAPSTDASLASTITGAVPGLLQSGIGSAGALAASNAQTGALNNAITTQQNTLGNINSIWGTQQSVGQGADTALSSSLGLGGAPANPSNFLNMPGYQFAVQQGTQAIQRQAAALGNAYTPNTAEAVGSYVTGTASQDYNTYINQLLGAAGLGTTANQGLQTANQAAGNNISSLQQNIGQAQAAGISGVANSTAGLFGVNGAGSSLLGAGANALGSNSATNAAAGISPSAISTTNNSGINYGDTSTLSGATSSTAPNFDPNTISGIASNGQYSGLTDLTGITNLTGDASNLDLGDLGNLYCDRRLKEAVSRLGVANNGLPLYEFNYKDDAEKTQHVGYMADEVLSLFPDAVTVGPKGFMMVNYSKVPA